MALVEGSRQEPVVTYPNSEDVQFNEDGTVSVRGDIELSSSTVQTGNWRMEEFAGEQLVVWREPGRENGSWGTENYIGMIEGQFHMGSRPLPDEWYLTSMGVAHWQYNRAAAEDFLAAAGYATPMPD